MERYGEVGFHIARPFSPHEKGGHPDVVQKWLVTAFTTLLAEATSESGEERERLQPVCRDERGRGARGVSKGLGLGAR